MAKQKADQEVLTVRNLTVRRSVMFALAVPEFVMRRGEVVCVAGANGSGKSTFLDTIAGLLTPDDGRIMINGQLQQPDDMRVRLHYGYIPDDDNWIIGELTAREYFALLSSIYRKAGIRHDMIAYAEQLAAKLLFDNFDVRLDELSHGNKKKVQIIAGLMHKPDCLIVDELRNGLDPVVIKQAEDLMKQLAKSGVGIIAATHDLWWAERFSDRVLMLLSGRIVLQDKTSVIVSNAGSVEAKFMQLFKAAV